MVQICETGEPEQFRDGSEEYPRPGGTTVPIRGIRHGGAPEQQSGGGEVDREVEGTLGTVGALRDYLSIDKSGIGSQLGGSTLVLEVLDQPTEGGKQRTLRRHSHQGRGSSGSTAGRTRQGVLALGALAALLPGSDKFEVQAVPEEVDVPVVYGEVSV